MAKRTCIRCGRAFEAKNGGRGAWIRFCSKQCKDTPPPREELSCTLPGCTKPAVRKARTICEMHFGRWLRHGSYESLTSARPQRGVCTVDGCGKTDAGPHGLCPKHVTRMRRHGDVHTVLPTGPKAGPTHPSWQGDDIKVKRAHTRVTDLRGPAKTHACVDCGGIAAHWSYDHLDPNEMMSEKHGPYSASPDHYHARCVPCHKAFDLDHLARKGRR